MRLPRSITPTVYQADMLIAALNDAQHHIPPHTDEFTVDKLHARRWVEGRALTDEGIKVARRALADRELPAAAADAAPTKVAPPAAALLAAGLAAALLGTVGALSSPDTPAPAPKPASGVTVALPDGDVPPECERAGDAVQLCVTVASRAPYGWQNADGSTVDVPDGRTMIRDLDETPGTAPWAHALAALDYEFREHAPYPDALDALDPDPAPYAPRG